jgi:anaerobic glycerol-3-phosphate dehydrogenase
MPQHVAIAGAGITGLACAYLLSKAGHKVTIVARNFYADQLTEWASHGKYETLQSASVTGKELKMFELLHCRASTLLAPHPDSRFPELQLASLKFYHHLLKTAPGSGVKVIGRLSINGELADEVCRASTLRNTTMTYSKMRRYGIIPTSRTFNISYNTNFRPVLRSASPTTD